MIEGFPHPGLLASGTHTDGEETILLGPGRGAGITEARLEKAVSRQFTVPGRLILPDVSYPVQEFSFSRTRDGFVAVNRPAGVWPLIRLELKLRPGTEVFDLTSLKVSPRGDGVETQVLVTRVMLSLVLCGEFRFVFEETLDQFAYDLELTPEYGVEIRHRAALFRKLAYIEDVFRFRVPFSLPEYIPGEALLSVEKLYRGLTEGEFHQRSEAVPWTIDTSKVDLDAPPFRGIGPIESRQERPITLFNHTLDVGPITVRALHAEIASPRELTKLRAASGKTARLEFNLLDYTVTIRFERYASLSRTKREARRRKFLYELQHEESVAVSETVDELLIDPLTAQVAERIAFGWLQINGLPDAIFPEQPVPVNDGRAWNVPLALRYQSTPGAHLAELRIDAYTGHVSADIPVEAILERADIVARQILHAG
jgi:hypothetical protein